ncbi:transcriptional repressor TraM [Sinorhizobium psoraleae]|uniref:Transcriptional repressor TraM n=1 Tax=Sinorhizobium psoraleae TaxID=520838 RepID=A0ABT4KN59_9HYPH|nr:transcriptional repressor TraM [Sinorhizobium psoraleae]MCZ4093409.1 transcriptional repressor TraM [Sinorhizobium psoraleae]
MNDVVPCETSDEREEKGTLYSSMQKSELEALAISAILEHRRLLAADEAVYEEWTRANDDRSVSTAVLGCLQDEYLERQKKSEAQQEVLSQIIDALGYIPDVPVGDESGQTKP